MSFVFDSKSDVNAKGLTSSCFSTCLFLLAFVLAWVVFDSEFHTSQKSRHFFRINILYSLWSTSTSLSSGCDSLFWVIYFVTNRMFMSLPMFLWKSFVKNFTVCFDFTLVFFFSFLMVLRNITVFIFTSYFCLKNPQFFNFFSPAFCKSLSDSMCLLQLFL